MKEAIIHCDWFKEHLRGKSSQAIKQRNVETIIELDVNCLMSTIYKFVRVISDRNYLYHYRTKIHLLKSNFIKSVTFN